MPGKRPEPSFEFVQLLTSHQSRLYAYVLSLPRALEPQFFALGDCFPRILAGLLHHTLSADED